MSTQAQANTSLDLSETAQKMVDAALAVTTGRLHLQSPADAYRKLQADDSTAITHFRYELARQIAGALLMMDPQVVAVFEDRDVADAAPDLGTPTRLVVQVRHHTAALRVVIGALDQALGQVFAEMLAEPPQTLIEAIVVDNRDRRLLDVGLEGLRMTPRLLTHRSYVPDRPLETSSGHQG